MDIKHFFAEVKTINTEDRTIDVVASTIDKDRDGDIILPSAFKKSLKSFKSNPVILACHQHRLQTGSSPVIGSAVTETIEITDKDFRFKMQFAATPLGEEYWTLYRDRHMRAFSIGFIPQKWEDSRDDNGRFTHRTYTQVELLEVSAVPVPSNRSALARAKEIFGADRVTSCDEDIERKISQAIEPYIIRIEDHFDEIKSLLIADSDRHAERLLGADSDSSGPDGEDKSESIVKTLNNINTKIGDNNNDIT